METEEQWLYFSSLYQTLWERLYFLERYLSALSQDQNGLFVVAL